VELERGSLLFTTAAVFGSVEKWEIIMGARAVRIQQAEAVAALRGRVLRMEFMVSSKGCFSLLYTLDVINKKIVGGDNTTDNKTVLCPCP